MWEIVIGQDAVEGRPRRLCNARDNHGFSTHAFHLEEADDGALGYDMDASPDGESVVRQLMFEVECMLSRLDQQGEGGES